MTTAGKGIFFDGTTSARHDVLVELAPGVSVEEVRAKTKARFRAADSVGSMV